MAAGADESAGGAEGRWEEAGGPAWEDGPARLAQEAAQPPQGHLSRRSNAGDRGQVCTRRVASL